MGEKKYIKWPENKDAQEGEWIGFDEFDGGYNPPIKMMLDDVKLKLENEVCKAVQRVGVIVNKEELIKALEYDRGQYDKGYADGSKYTAKDILSEMFEWLIIHQFGVDENLRPYVPAKEAYDKVCEFANRWGVPLVETEDGKKVVWPKFERREE